MTGRLTGRAAFADLRRSGRQVRVGPLRVRFAPRPEGPARVGYAIGRPVGSAVERNRLRRRLREIVRSVDAAEGLRAGAYLLLPAPEAATMTYQELDQLVRQALRDVVELP